MLFRRSEMYNTMVRFALENFIDENYFLENEPFLSFERRKGHRKE